MNELNYASLEASKRLVDVGIVLETEAVWATDGCDWLIMSKDDAGSWLYCIPSPSMAEVWRELPEGTTIAKDATHSGAFVISISRHDHQNTNPTDALIDLLIWVRRKP